MAFYVTTVTFLMTLLINKSTILSSQLTFSSSKIQLLKTHIDIFSILALESVMNLLPWMIEIEMNNHLVSDKNCNILNLWWPNVFQGITYNVSFTLNNVGDTTRAAYNLYWANRVGNTRIEYLVQCWMTLQPIHNQFFQPEP